METIAKVRRLYHKQGLSLRQIAKTLNLNRRTVSKYLNTIEPPVYSRSQQHYPALGHFMEPLQQRMEAEISLPAKQRLTAQRHFEWLCTQGYTGSYSAVRRFVAAFRQTHHPQSPEVYIPLYFPPAQAYQFDWSTETVKLAGQICKIELAQFRLCHSRAFFLRAYRTQRMEMFLDAHNHAFAYFGGVPERGIYDNLKTAVTTVLEGKKRILTEKFEAMMNHFNIEPVA